MRFCLKSPDFSVGAFSFRLGKLTKPVEDFFCRAQRLLERVQMRAVDPGDLIAKQAMSPAQACSAQLGRARAPDECGGASVGCRRECRKQRVRHRAIDGGFDLPAEGEGHMALMRVRVGSVANVVL